jgi:GDPmannose 4,6-dehydratase
MKVLIFGANSQDGHYLATACRRRGAEVMGVSRSGDWLKGDVASFELVESLVREHRPDLVVHLAAWSTTRHDALFENHATIGGGTLNVLEAVKRWSPGSKVFITGSGLQFVNAGRPIAESDPFGHGSGYTAVRNYSVYLARYYRELGIRAYVGYLFHHESPLRKLQHVSQAIIAAVSRIAKGSGEVIEVGDISVEKEWTFAGDVVEGILTLVGQDRVFEAVIGSGKALSIENWLDCCFTLIGRDWRDHVRPREGFIPEYGRLVSDPRTINALGWRPRVDMAELARMMLAAADETGILQERH